MGKPRILLLTATFPYRGGEPFLDMEVRALSEHFDLFILPCGAVIFEKTFDLPDNVRILEKEAKEIHSRRRNLASLIGASLSSLPDIFEEGTRNLPLSFHPKGFARTAWRSARAHIIAPIVSMACSREGVELIYSYWMSYEALAAAKAVKKHGSKCLTLTRAHGHDLYHYANTPGYCPFQKKIIEEIGHVATVSLHGEKYLKNRYGEFAEKVSTFRLGVPPGPANKGSKDGVFRIVSCSALKPVKRVHLIAEALQFADFPLVWTHIGDGPEMPRLSGIVTRTLDSNPGISIRLAGNMDNSNVMKFYDSNPVDLFVNVSMSEGIAVSIMEAISRGIPAIATDVGGTSEIISDDLGSGWLLPVNFKPAALTSMIKGIRQTNSHIAAKGKAFQAWDVLFNAEKNYANYTGWLLKWITRAKTPEVSTNGLGKDIT